MNRRLKYIWAMLWYHTGLMTLCERLQEGKSDGRAVILMYHRVIPNKWKIRVSSVPEIKVNEGSFEKQLQFLSKSYNVISFEELIRTLKTGTPFPAKTVVITFDDGWEDNYLFAWPLLKKYQLPAIIFLTTGYIGTNKVFWQERFLSLLDRLSHEPESLKSCFQDKDSQQLHPFLHSFVSGENIDNARIKLLNQLKTLGDESIEKLIGLMTAKVESITLPDKFKRRKSDFSINSNIFDDDNSFLNWEQVKEMDSSLLSYGSHGINHTLLDKAKDKVVINELHESRKHIETKLSETIRYFAYPNGNYDDRTIQFLKEAGYEASVTTDEGFVSLTDNPYLLKRINICENRFQGPNGRFSKEMFAAYLSGCMNMLNTFKSNIPQSLPSKKESMDRHEVEKAKWDSKTSDISEETEKDSVDSYDEVFLKMNTLRPIHKFFELEGKTASILDVGCGAGWTSLLLAQKAREVHAIDISHNSIKKLNHYKIKYSLLNINAIVGDGEILPYPDNSFDFVFGNASLHHLILEKVISETSRVLKKGGKAAFCEPFAHNPIINFYRFVKHNFLEEFHGTDKPLTYSDKGIFTKHFSDVSFVECSFLSDNIPALRTLESSILEKLPFTRRFASYITILATK